METMETTQRRALSEGDASAAMESFEEEEEDEGEAAKVSRYWPKQVEDQR